MPHDHSGHHHHHIDPEAGDLKVALAIGVNLLLTLAQIIGGLLSGSIALIADAIHNLSDALTLVIAFAARRIARRPADGQMTFGYGRAEIVAALINYVSLIVLGLWLIWEAASRLLDPQPVEGWVVVILAGVALAVDLVTAALTFRLAKDSMNIRAAFLHNVADAASSVAVIVAGTLILLFGWWIVDPLATLLIAGYILWHGLSDIGPVIRILMLGTPGGTDAAQVQSAMAAVEGVADVHHVHLWAIDEHRVSVEAHVVVAPGSLDRAPSILCAVKRCLSDRFGIRHSTLEVERQGEGCAVP